MDELPEVLTVEEAAAVLRIGRRCCIRAGAPVARDQRSGRATGGGARPDPARPTGRASAPARRELPDRLRTVTVGLSRRELRRQLGPVAWCALEDLVEDAHVDALGRRVATTSVRHLAGHLGVSKDTSARALLRLRHAGLVEPLAPVRGDTGRFGHGTYLVHTSVTGPTPPAPTSPTVRPPSSARPATEQQPSLFDEDLAGTAAPGAGKPDPRDPATRTPEQRTRETRTPAPRTQETRTPETRTPEPRKLESRNRDDGNADGRDADDGEAVHTLAPCGAVSSPADAGERRAGEPLRC